MEWKVFAFLICVCLMVMPFVQADPGYGMWVFTDTSKFRLTIYSLSSGVSYTNSSLSWNTTAEYFEFTLNATSSTDQTARFEFTVPDCYMGLSVWEWDGTAWVLKDGSSGWALSVPYDWNDTSTPVYDWGSSGLGAGSGQWGIVKRVQLAVPLTASTTKQLKIQVYYATTPAVGMIKNKVIFPPMKYETYDAENSITLKMLYLNPSDYYQIMGGIGCSPFRGWEFLQNKISGKAHYNWRDNGISSDTYGSAAESSASLGVVKTITSKFIRSNNTYQFIKNGIVNEERTHVNLSVANLTGSNFIIGCDYAHSPIIFYNASVIINGSTKLLINASSFSGGSNTTVVDFSGNGNHGTAYGNVQYKVYTGSGFKVTYVGEVPLEFLTDQLISGYGTLLGKKLNAAVAELENGSYANAFEVLYAYNYTLKLIANEKAFAWYNITDYDAVIVLPNTTGRYAMAIDHDQKLIQVYFANPISAINATDVFSVPNAVEWLQGAWGVGVYGVLLLLPASVYVRSKNAGAAALLLLAMSAAGIAIDPGVAPLATLVIVVASALLLYRVMYKPQ